MLLLSLLLLFIASTTLAVVLTKRRAEAQALREALAQKERVEREVATLQAQKRELEKYQGVVDAEAEARAIRDRAVAEAEAIRGKALAEAETVRNNAAGAAAGVHSSAALEAAELRRRSESVLAGATLEASRIVESANKRAQEVAGEAFAAIQHAKHLEQTATAMRNIIEGYGDRYLVPTQGILDELAEHFGFTEAGARLKSARERMRELIRTGKAASCDYVETNRRTTAIEFVLDAFNGKVDSILAGVRHDNFGTLEQKVKDAFSVVNNNGQAFRNARIAPDYLAVRMEELKWAVVANELKLKEREEQRLIKERIREEEKAQREFEKAQRDAEKEEELLRKAMEEARREFEKAGDEQKSKYEEQLAQLAQKLQEAEEKNKRAISMAQQTKTGHVYVISNVGSFGENVFKVGLTRRLEPLDRIRELGDASVPFEFDVHALIHSEDAPTLERELHKRFVREQVNKVNPRKEFFRLTLQTIRQVVDGMGLQAQWTMTAEAREFRETQAVERAMQSQSFQEGAWLQQQLAKHEAAQIEVARKEAVA
ncbi:DUF4041 domain-containing protein [Corallococcus sp. EGB]|uniref:DUF4041 domain-containing protein n=1 Tax=Corallococcus sp. EGB TaxID=1521117 RepID=UPI001CBCEF62|nr:DUF4041 domain-containing protein [Corallococcus sp. EGB]